MIILELLVFLVGIIFLSLSFSGLGSLFTLKLKSDFFLDIFCGLIITSLIVTFVHFFFKINFIIAGGIFLIGIILFFLKKNISIFLEKKDLLPYFIIVFLLLPIFISQKYHEDFGYYHLPYSLAFIEEKIVFGFANIDIPYVYNSIWLNLYPIFFIENKNFDFLTLPSFLLFLSFIIFSIKNIIEKKDQIKNSDYYLIVILFYFLLKFTRISEFGVDFPAIIFSVLSIYYFIKFYETKENLDKKSFFYFNLFFAIFAILIKLSAALIIILPIFLFLTNFKDLKFYILSLRFLAISFLCIIFFVQQFIYTGCFLFPTTLTCLNVSWFNPEHIDLSKRLELINKSYSSAKGIYSPEEYLSNFNWFLIWIKRNFKEILEHLMTMILPILIFVLVSKKKLGTILVFEKKLILVFFIILSLIFWLNYSPVLRFAIHIYITLIFLFFSKILISKEFSKKKFIIFISVFLVFNFSKNILRISDTEKIFLGIQKIENEYLLDTKTSNKYANIYYPDFENNKKNGWQGRLCWDTPFICSYNKLDVSKKNGYLVVDKLKN
ncbi:hypothetical protein IDG53_02735 [Pelagibacterales bacterium SAG-MED11]|nr:hypothetical protein [Pelagibacterales bacterium SAG-MED11]